MTTATLTRTSAARPYECAGCAATYPASPGPVPAPATAEPYVCDRCDHPVERTHR